MALRIAKSIPRLSSISARCFSGEGGGICFTLTDEQVNGFDKMFVVVVVCESVCSFYSLQYPHISFKQGLLTFQKL
jgi:hypothetical protein